MTRSEDAVAAPPMPRERGSRDDILRRERGPAVGREEPAHEGVQRVLNAGRVAIDERCEPAAPVAREERDEPRARAPCQPAGANLDVRGADAQPAAGAGPRAQQPRGPGVALGPAQQEQVAPCPARAPAREQHPTPR